jgi:succinoglycan biosynthesis protein ExoM
MDETRRVSIDVAICTFHREELLADLIRSIDGATPEPAIELRLIVVDNSDEGTAAATIENLSSQVRYPITYLQAHPPNISVARNAAAAASSADYVAFLDDDTKVAPGWIGVVLKATANNAFDAYFGPIRPVYVNPKAVSPVVEMIFRRESALDDLAEVAPGTKARVCQGFVLSTSNIMLRRSTMLFEAEPFDFYFGDNGGEDLLFLTRMHRLGRRFAWMSEAVIYEHVPASRCTTDYLRLRLVAGGQSFAWIEILNSRRPWMATCRIIATSLAQLAIGMALYLGAAAFGGKAKAEVAALRLAGPVGKLTFWSRRTPLYRQENAVRVPSTRSHYKPR